MSIVVRVVAPFGRDADLIVSLLRGNGLAAEACLTLPPILEQSFEVGPLLIAEEALSPGAIASLGRFVSTQPPWSDLPLLILTTSGGETETSRSLHRERIPLGSPVLLERPIRTASLVSSVQAAVRARRRQYEVRNALEERDRAAAELKLEQEVLRTVLNSTPVGIALARPDGQIVMTNPMVETILRHPVLSTPFPDERGQRSMYHSDGRPVLPPDFPITRAMATGRSVAGDDYLYQRGDGQLSWVRLSAAPVLDEHGQVTGGVVAIIDVDEEHRAADALRRSEERFRVMVERAGVGIVIGNLSGSLSYMNPMLLQTLGFSEQDVADGKLRWDSLTPPEFAAADAHAVEQLRTAGVCEPYQKACYARDGRVVPLLVVAARLPSQALSDQQEVAIFLTDLSSQKRAEAALIQSEKLAAVGRLAASISHEINNPLEAVTNLLYLVGSEETSAQAKEYLEMASQELARVSQIVGQTLRFHRQSTRPRSVTPRELLESVLALYQGRMTNASVEVFTEFRGEPQFVVYEGDIRQVLNNLVGNAIDAMRGDGRLRVRSRLATHPRTGERGVRITIADNGHGMPPETARHIFDPFYTTKGIHGTGLGLWISQGIVEKHSGEITVRSRTADGKGSPGGTVFSVFLPREQTRQTQPDVA